MFGINSFDLVGQIVEGHYYEVTKKENDLFEKRMKICKECPLYSESFLGPVCDSKKCWNEKEGKVDNYPSSESTCGCGCRLEAKSRIERAKCVLNKW